MRDPDWQSADGRVKLFLGDCLGILPTMEAGSVGGVITDPPYSSGGQFRGDRAQKALSKYVRSESIKAGHYQDFGGDSRDQRSFFAWCSLWLCACHHVANRGAVLCCFSDWRQVPVMTDAVQSGGWTWRNLCTWWKPGCRMQKGRFSSSSEFLLYATAGPHDSDGEESPQNVISCQTMQTEDKEHIAEKPLEVVTWAVSVSKKSETILDPFMGSGTTGVACVRLGRRFIGIEKEPRYFAIAVKRIQREIEQGVLPFPEPETFTPGTLFTEAAQ